MSISMTVIIRKTMILLAAFFTLIYSCTLVYSQQIEGDEISEAVFRYQIKHLATERKREMFYLASGLSEPKGVSVEMMQRFADMPTKVRNYQPDKYNLVNLRAEKGMVIGLSEIRYNSKDTTEVAGYNFVAPGEAEGWRCIVGREKSRWMVKSCRGTWIA